MALRGVELENLDVLEMAEQWYECPDGREQGGFSAFNIR